MPCSGSWPEDAVVPIKKSRTGTQIYVSHHYTYAMNMMLVCNPCMGFMDVVVKYYNAYVWFQCGFYSQLNT